MISDKIFEKLPNKIVTTLCRILALLYLDIQCFKEKTIS